MIFIDLCSLFKKEKKMDFNMLTAISPIDGRYRNKTEALSPFFSEFGLIRYRVLVEIEYFIALCEWSVPELSDFPASKYEDLRNLYKHFDMADAERIKEIERTTNHDVKAVEYFLREKLDAFGISAYKEFIHFGLTSQDINNTAIPLSLKDAVEQHIYPEVLALIHWLTDAAKKWMDVPMLARTHGQAASPTRIGKELMVFSERLQKQFKQLESHLYYGKFGGATGNFNAHFVAYPQIDWMNFANAFLNEKLGLKRNQFTTQIDHYDDMSEVFDVLRRTNVILIDLCRDLWTYISLDYFKQQTKKDEVGSSAMPHKVNPIDFENAEGNLGIANALFDFFSNKLPISRMQRDLTDSTVLRNIGVPLSHSIIAYQSLLKGFGKLMLHPEKLEADLEENWAVVAEAIQTILRKEGYPNPYNKLKEFSRGKGKMDKNMFEDFIKHLDVSDSLKKELASITPFNYIGRVPEIPLF